FQATGSAVRNLASTEEKIMAGYYPYSKKLPGVSPPRYAPPYAIIPPGLRALFERCFVGGHRNPKIRPTAEEWMEELRVALDDLQVCSVNENHCYSSHLNECPWCALKKRGKHGKDIFPKPKITQSGHGKIVNAFIRDPAKTESGHDKTGMDVSTPSKTAVPELDLPDKIFSFVICDENELIRQKFVVRNIGDGKMYGSISTGCDWISISPAVIDTYSLQMAEFTVDASKMDSVDNGVKYAGKIDISSNGGNSSVIVNILFKTEPVLEISDHVLSIRGVRRGAFESGFVKIINSGTGRLKGTVSADRDWIVVDKNCISIRESETLEVGIDTTLMDSRFFHSGRVTIDTNGGRKEILIVLTLIN
ncbi:MAG: hypothetical protein KAW93_00640, partial [Methanogenium sp.]|nr:hypothetical protein [Methanogenium sp.]